MPHFSDCERLGEAVDSADERRLGSRRAQRWQIDAGIDARDGTRRARALATDISISGIRLRTLNPAKIGQRFWVKLDCIEAREVTVLWVEGYDAGCAFTQPMAEYVLDHVLEEAKRADAAIDRRSFPGL